MKFLDRKAEFPNRIKLEKTEQEDIYDIQRAEGNIKEAGTPLNAKNLNKITEDLENRLEVFRTNLINLIYPVGSVYLSLINASPETFLGGKWETLIAGPYLRIGAATQTADSNGGSNTITVTNLPSHSHNVYFDAVPNNAIGGTATGTAHPNSVQINVASFNTTSRVNTLKIGNTGSGTAFYPVYKNVYAWRRIS